MARQFVSASGQYLSRASAIVTAYPFTMGLWFRANNITGAHNLIDLNASANSTNYWEIEARGNVAGDPVRFQTNDGSGSAIATTSTGFSANIWHTAMAVAASATDRKIYLDGASEGSNTTSRSPIVNETYIGAFKGSAVLNGRAAWVTFWNVVLSADERVAFAKGVHPLNIRTLSIVGCYPIWGDHSPEINLVGGNALTVNGSPAKADGPPVRVFTRMMTLELDASGAGAVGPSRGSMMLTGAGR